MGAFASNGTPRREPLKRLGTLAFAFALSVLPAAAHAQAEPTAPSGAAGAGAPPPDAGTPPAAPETIAPPAGGQPGAPVPSEGAAEEATPAPPPRPAPTGPGAPTTVCEGKTIAKLDIEGQGRVSKDDILATIRLRRGMPCTDAEISRDVQALWDMGYFKDIQVEATRSGDGVAVVYRVKERPAIGEVKYEGNDEIDTADIEEKVTLEQGSVLAEPTVREQLDNIRKLYAEKGFFLAEVRYELDPRPNNEVTVRFIIDEGDEVTVRRIRFIGNEHLTASDLRAVMQTSETGFLSFLSSNNTYRKEIIDEDVNRLQALYYDYGYLTVEMTDPRIELTPDRRHIDITIAVREGPRFKVGRVKAMEIDADGKEIEPLEGRKTLREMVTLNQGDWFSRSAIAKDLQGVTRYYRDKGYARVEVNPQTDLHMDTRIVDVVVTVRRGPLVYIQRINVKGNTKTRDEVLRREARIVEGQLYSQTLVERSKERMMSLGYFESVEVSEEDGSTPDRIVINYEVAERPTGTFQLGAGFSSQETFLLTGQVQQENLFGRGQSLGLNLQFSGIRQQAQLRFVEPYLYSTDWTMAVDLFKIRSAQRNFNRDSTGGNLTFGHPLYFIDEDLRIFLNYRLEFVDISPATGGAFGAQGEAFDRYLIRPIRNLFRSGRTSSLRLSLNWDTRDNRLFPTKGLYVVASTEVSDTATLSETNFIENEINFRGYHPIIGPLVGKLNVDWAMITSRDGLGVPVFERYFLGGITDIRGFPIQTVGPRIGAPSTYNDPGFLQVGDLGIPIGGNMQFYYNLEVEFTIIESVGIKGVVFTDGGNAWNMEQTLCKPEPLIHDSAVDPCGIHPFNLRFSWGFGLRWFSPLGPLRFEWGFPINKRPWEDVVEFQFTVGNAF